MQVLERRRQPSVALQQVAVDVQLVCVKGRCLLGIPELDREGLQELFIALDRAFDGLGDPFPQGRTACSGDRVELLVWAGGLHDHLKTNEPLTTQALQFRVDLTMTSGPEETERLPQESREVVARQLSSCEKAEQGIAERGYAHGDMVPLMSLCGPFLCQL